MKSTNIQSQVDKPRAACTECDRSSDFCQHHKNSTSSRSTSKNSKRVTRYQPYPPSSLDNQPKIPLRSKKNDQTITNFNNNELKQDKEVIIIDSSSDEEDSHASSQKVYVAQTDKPESCTAAPIAEPTATEQEATKKSRVIRKVKSPHRPVRAATKKPLAIDQGRIATTRAGRVSVKLNPKPVSSCASLDITQGPNAVSSKRKASDSRRAKSEPYAAAKPPRKTLGVVGQESNVSVQEKDSSGVTAEPRPKRKASVLTETPDLSTTSDQADEPLCKSRRKSLAKLPSKKRASRVTTNKRTSRSISSGGFIIDLNALAPATPEPEEEEPVPEKEEPVPEKEEPVPEKEEPVPEKEEPVPEEEGRVPEIDYLQLIKDDLSTLRIKKDELIVSNKVLGEGQVGIVYKGMYGQTRVACKAICLEIDEEYFYFQMYKELVFSRKFSECHGVIRYLGWTFDDDNSKFYLIQPLIDNGDARKYLFQKGTFNPEEVLAAGVCLFSALKDAHAADVGILDLKLENFLIDSSGLGFLTDLGSCIEFYGGDSVNLHDEEVQWTRSAAAPEMIRKRNFSKASDVFMGTLMLAESMTSELSDIEFRNEVLHRKANGAVCFSPERTNARYSSYFDLLSKGLQNEASRRPTAEEMLSGLVALKDGGLTVRA
ncbi:hypothetical protein INT48_006005 [Thamnidium elegans]|uniref:Protein kinase domain-containing protein n=1 Tax=Thamnidium elegans TaxID=101142 RepID=A0A8H7SQ78_9FUNG|nr:hypothetical protein INT48_006005 [Thamnidium elegans]